MIERLQTLAASLVYIALFFLMVYGAGALVGLFVVGYRSVAG